MVKIASINPVDGGVGCISDAGGITLGIGWKNGYIDVNLRGFIHAPIGVEGRGTVSSLRIAQTMHIDTSKHVPYRLADISGTGRLPLHFIVDQRGIAPVEEILGKFIVTDLRSASELQRATAVRVGKKMKVYADINWDAVVKYVIYVADARNSRLIRRRAICQPLSPSARGIFILSIEESGGKKSGQAKEQSEKWGVRSK